MEKTRKDLLLEWKKKREQAKAKPKPKPTSTRKTNVLRSPRKRHVFKITKCSPIKPSKQAKTPQDRLVETMENLQLNSSPKAEQCAMTILHTLDTRIEEAAKLAKYNLASSRAAFDLLSNSAEYPHARSSTLFWIARAKMEEQAGNFNEVVKLFEDALSYIDDKASKVILNATLEDFIERTSTQQVITDADNLLNPSPEIAKTNVTPKKRLSFSNLNQELSSAINDLSNEQTTLALTPPDKKSSTPEVSKDLQDYLFSEDVEEFEDAIEEDPNLKDDLKAENGTRTNVGTTPGRVPLIDLSLEEQAEYSSSSRAQTFKEEEGATRVMLTTIRTPRKDREKFGTDKVAIPVRRSVRNAKQYDDKQQNMLEATGFAYTPNSALKTLSRSSSNVKTEASAEKEKENARKELFTSAFELTEISKIDETSSEDFTDASSFLGRFEDLYTSKSSGIATPVRRSRRLTTTPGALRRHVLRGLE